MKTCFLQTAYFWEAGCRGTSCQHQQLYPLRKPGPRPRTPSVSGLHLKSNQTESTKGAKQPPSCPLPLLPNAVEEEAGRCGPPGDSPARKPSFPNSNKQKSTTEHRLETPARLVPARHASGWPRGSSGRPREDGPRTTQAPARHRPSSEAGTRHGAPRLWLLEPVSLHSGLGPAKETANNRLLPGKLRPYLCGLLAKGNPAAWTGPGAPRFHRTPSARFGSSAPAAQPHARSASLAGPHAQEAHTPYAPAPTRPGRCPPHLPAGDASPHTPSSESTASSVKHGDRQGQDVGQTPGHNTGNNNGSHGGRPQHKTAPGHQGHHASPTLTPQAQGEPTSSVEPKMLPLEPWPTTHRQP